MAIPSRLFRLLFALILCGSLKAQTDPGSFRFQKIASWPGFARGETRDLQVINGKAYMAMADGGLCIADYSNPANPTVLSRLDLDGSSEVIKVIGNYAYLCSRTAGLHIVDISNPAAPTLKGRFNSGADVKEVAINDTLAFVAAGAEGVIALDLTNPALPVRLGSYDTKGEGLDVEAYTIYNTNGVPTRRTIWVADGTNGIVYLDALDPRNIRYYDTQATAGTVGVERVGRYVFYLDSHPSDNLSSLWFHDALYPIIQQDWPAGFFNFASRKFNLRVDTAGAPYGAWVQSTGGALYEAVFLLRNNQILSYSGLPSSNPTTAFGASTDGTNDYFSVGGVGVQVMNGTNVLSVSTPGGFANRIRLAGDRIYLGDTYQGLHILKANADGTVQKLSTYNIGYQRGFDVSASNLFLGAGTNIHIVDVTNPANPTLLANAASLLPAVAGGASPRDITVSNQRLFVSGNSPFAVFDVSTPAQPKSLWVHSGISPFGMNIIGTNLFGSASGLVCYGIGPDNSLTLRKTELTGTANVLPKVIGNIAYFPAHATGLRLIDVTNPDKFSTRSVIDTPGSAVSVWVDGNLAYVANVSGGVSIIDVANPDQPTLVAQLATQKNAFDVQVQNDFIYVANGGEGLTVWKKVPVAGQHIDFAAIPDLCVLDEPFAISAVASSGLPVQISVTGPAKFQNGQIVLTGGVGAVRVIATQPGNNDFVSATAERDFIVRDVPSAVMAYVLANHPNASDEDIRLDGDPDGDGIANIVEFLFRSDPWANTPDGRVTADIFEFFGNYYLIAHFQKPRISKYPIYIEVADFNDLLPRTWVRYPADVDSTGHGDFVWLIQNDGSFPLIRLVVEIQ